MRIGIVSDTHNNLRNVQKIVELFNAADVQRVIHTGDITQAKTLDVLSHLNAPMSGVYGNNDEGEKHSLVERAEIHGFELYDPPHEFTLHGRAIIVAHDPLELHGHIQQHHNLVLHGHTHMYRHEMSGDQLTFNPGECAGHMRGFNAIGIVDLTNLQTELLRF